MLIYDLYRDGFEPISLAGDAAFDLYLVLHVMWEGPAEIQISSITTVCVGGISVNEHLTTPSASAITFYVIVTNRTEDT